jgi:hypothetical protein
MEKRKTRKEREERYEQLEYVLKAAIEGRPLEEKDFRGLY